MMRTEPNGFTMVELIVVIVVIGILSTLAAARFIGRDSVAAPAFAQQTRAMLRFGQKLAIAQNRPVFVSFAANRIALCFNSDCTARVLAPGGGNAGSAETQSACNDTTWYCEGTPGGVTLASPVALMFFDQQGQPFAGSDATGTDNSTFMTLSVAISGAEASENVVVERETGYVH